jgi:hypothetical protein
MLRPSGVSSGSEESCAASASSRGVTPGAGRNADACDGPGLVEQEDVDVARRLHRAARHRDDVLRDQAADPRHADRREQRADGRGDQADEQRDQHGDRHRLAGFHRRDAVDRERQERDRGVQEDQRQAGEQDRERDLVRRLLPPGRLDHPDHAVEERLARVGGDLHDEPVGEQARPAGDRAEVAARLADHRCGLAGDRALVDRADAFDDLAVRRDEVAGLDQHDVAAAQHRARNLRPVLAPARLRQLLRHHLPARATQARRLRLRAALSDRLGEVGEQHGEPEPDRHVQDESRRRLALAEERLQEQHRGEDRADVHHEHHGVARLRTRRELAERIRERFAQRRAAEEVLRERLGRHGRS